MEAALVSAARSGTSLEGLLVSPSLTTEVLNRPASCGVTALHVAVWRNHLGLVERLLEAGADPNVADHESGWTSVHSALHWGNLQALAELLQADGNLAVTDWKGRTPVDLASAELKEFLSPGSPGEVFAWGNGSNYTLGTGSTAAQLAPARVDSLHEAQVVLLSAAKFHSAAVSADGKLYTWGWGRSGRLGHPEAHIHSGESAVIAPRLVSSLGRRQVLGVAAAKHHTVFCTTAGEVYTMGSNRYGQLGYAVDTQPTPRRVGALKARVVAVAAANKHSVAISAGGDCFTWGSNALGQLGYGTSDSLSNASPRLVEAMKGKGLQAAAAAKRHTVVLTADGEVFTWGHRGVSPRRVALAGSREVHSAFGEQLWFHRGHQDVFRPQAVAICAGAAHTSVLTRTGVVLCWRSADPALAVQEVGGALAGKRVVSISAGKYRTAAVSDEGDVFMWEGRSDYFPAEGRQSGSGSKKGMREKGRPIPGAGVGMHTLAGSLGAGSPSPAEVGSYGSYSKKGSYFERFARDRESERAQQQPSGLSFGGRPGSAKPGQQGDVFAKIQPERVEGLKRAVAVAVGEKHSLALQHWSAAQLPGLQRVPWLALLAAAASPAERTAAAAADEEAAYQRAADGLGGGGGLSTPRSTNDLEAEASGLESMVSSPERVASPSCLARLSAREPGAMGVPSLQRICEEEVARQLVDPRTALQVLEYADVAGADLLRAYCLAVVVCNLDAVLLEARGALEQLPRHLLAELERLWKQWLGSGGGSGSPPEQGSGLAGAGTAPVGGPAASRSPSAAPEPAGPQEEEPGGRQGAGEGEKPAVARWIGSRLQLGARPTAATPSLGSDALEHDEHEMLQASPSKLALWVAEGQSSFKDTSAVVAEAEARRLLRALQKKLQQIDSLEQRASEGAVLDPQQRAKVAQRPIIRSALSALEGGMAVDEVQVILKAASAGREEEEAAASGGGGSGSSSAPGGRKGGGEDGKARQGGQAQKGAHRATPATEPVAAASSAAAQAAGAAATPEGPAGSSSSEHPAASQASSALERLSLGDSANLLGSSPPNTVPAFGPLGHAGAEPRPFPSARSSSGGQVEVVVGGFRGLEARPPKEERPKSAGPKSKEKSKRTGGLSKFLRGDLEKPPTPPPAAPGAAPAVAWGAKPAAPAPSASLKEILSQQAASAAPLQPKPAAAAASGGGRGTPGSAPRPRAQSSGLEAPMPTQAGAGALRMSLASFMTTSPLAIQKGSAASSKSPPPPAWGGAAGASPPAAAQSSFRLIQEEQQALAAARTFSTSPQASHRPSAAGGSLPPWRPPAGAAAGAAGSTAGPSSSSSSLLGSSPTGSSLMGTSPSGRTFSVARPQHSKWYVPEERQAPKSIRSIQTEEVAVKELSKLYGSANVRIVPKERRSPGLPPPAAAPKQG